eukprot:6175045-Pleurochrysis_carterae.AAC.1
MVAVALEEGLHAEAERAKAEAAAIEHVAAAAAAAVAAADAPPARPKIVLTQQAREQMAACLAAAREAAHAAVLRAEAAAAQRAATEIEAAAWQQGVRRRPRTLLHNAPRPPLIDPCCSLKVLSNSNLRMCNQTTASPCISPSFDMLAFVGPWKSLLLLPASFSLTTRRRSAVGPLSTPHLAALSLPT